MKVRTSPNSKFADIDQIQRTQLAAGEAITIDNDGNESDKSNVTLDYIEIE